MPLFKPGQTVKVKEIKRSWWSNKITREIEDFIAEVSNKSEKAFVFEISYSSENIFQLACFITFVFEGEIDSRVERLFLEI